MDNQISVLTRDELSAIIEDTITRVLSKLDNQPQTQSVSETLSPIRGIHELAKFLGVSPARAQKLKNEGFFPYFQNGRTVLFNRSDVLAAMQTKKL